MLPNCVPVPSVGSGSGGKPVVFNCGNSGRPKLLNGFGILGNSPSKGSVSKTFLNLSIVDSAPSYGLAVPNFSAFSSNKFTTFAEGTKGLNSPSPK